MNIKVGQIYKFVKPDTVSIDKKYRIISVHKNGYMVDMQEVNMTNNNNVFTYNKHHLLDKVLWKLESKRLVVR